MTASLMQLAGGLFVGCGIALSYGTLFLRPGTYRPTLGVRGAEARLRMLDTIDRLRPQPLDWVLTSALLIPGAGLGWLGARQLFQLAPVIVGAVSWLGPLAALGGLALRQRAATRLAAELEAEAAGDRLTGTPAGHALPAAADGDGPWARASSPSSSSPRSSSPRAPTRRD